MCKKLPIPIVETIKKRCSVRTYQDKELEPDVREMLQSYMDNLENPFGMQVKKYIIDKKLASEGEKLGTYGVIKGASTFMGISVPDKDLAHVAAGYEFENLILEATALGLGTVWLAATFNREGFASAMGVPKDELFPAISPVGYPAAKRSLTESLMRTAMRSSSRKEWNTLFYLDNFQTPLHKDESGDYAEPLEMLRLAPSDKNTQPWRVLKASNSYHFFVTYKSGISRGEEIIKRVDAGIALSHFHQTVLELGLKGCFKQTEPENIELPQNTYYITSWHA
ncbi:nitroreductase family protein [Bacteroides sp. An269]|uniref:nitroreductase family protein n=1 Tax=Bacteroides sp. An269 TaxID=1965613 RepID=UPI000B37D0B7|nr:nitroreductase family protein [Bacteroides sp. An269]OUO82242.1 nitroreductase [Bacteroides sp. An269]